MRFAISFFALAASVAAQLDVSASAIAATRLATSHQWVTSADGVKIFAEAIGSPNNPHVILAHGLACTHSAFDPLWNDANLQKSLYMVRYDTRGHGQTDKPATAAGYNSSRYAQDVEAVVKAFSLKRPFFAGWSLAGAIAVDLASYYPPTLAGLPFSGFISFAGLPSMDLIPSVTTDLVRSFVPGLIDSANATNAVQTRINFAGTLSSQQTSVPFDVLTQWVGSASYLPPVTANFVLTRTQDNTNFFKVGKAGWPTLILFGDADDQVIPTDVLNVMKPFTKQESHIYPGAGHIVFYDAEPQVAQNLLAFVKKYYSAK